MQHIKWQVRMATWTAARCSPHVHLGSKKKKNSWRAQVFNGGDICCSQVCSIITLPYSLRSVLLGNDIKRGHFHQSAFFPPGTKSLSRSLMKCWCLCLVINESCNEDPRSTCANPFSARVYWVFPEKMNVWEYSEIYFVLVRSSSRWWTAMSAS